MALYRDENYNPRHDDPHYYDDEDAREAERLDAEELEQREQGDLDIRFCDDCGREVMGDFCSACREHERRRDESARASATFQRLNKLNFRTP